jgi:hypothetical protein
MTIQIFATDVLRWDIFLSTSTSFSALSSLIHKQIIEAATQIRDLYIYVGTNSQIQGLELAENFEILLVHSPIECVHIIVDRTNAEFQTIDRAIRFMRDVYDYNVCIAIAQTQIIYNPGDDR